MKKSELRYLIREEIDYIMERLSFDEDKFNKFIKNTDNKMLKHLYKTKNGKDDPEKFFYIYIIGDDDFEELYIND
jgi:hypothetical protein